MLRQQWRYALPPSGRIIPLYCNNSASCRRHGGPTIHNGNMAIKVVAVDDENTQHLIIGLNRDNIDSLLNGDVFTLPHGIAITLTENSDIVLLFAETDEDLEKRFPRPCGPFSSYWRSNARRTPLISRCRCATFKANKWRTGPTSRQRSHLRPSSCRRSGATSLF